MSCCCSNVYELCKVALCSSSVLRLGVPAPDPGEYMLITSFLGTRFVIQKTFVQDEELIFPIGSLNENYVFIAQIIKPDGTTLVIEKDTETFDCVAFETVISYNL